MIHPLLLALLSVTLFSSAAAAQAVSPGAPDGRQPVQPLMAPGDVVPTVDTFATSVVFRRDLGAVLPSGRVLTSEPFPVGGRRFTGRTVESGSMGGGLPARVGGILIRALARAGRDLELECCRPDPLREAARDLLWRTAGGALIELATGSK